MPVRAPPHRNWVHCKSKTPRKVNSLDCSVELMHKSMICNVYARRLKQRQTFLSFIVGGSACLLFGVSSWFPACINDMQTHIGSLLMQNVELTYFQAWSIACVCLMKFAYGFRSKLSTTCQTFLHRMENLKTRRCKRKRNIFFQMLRAEAGDGNKQQEQPFRRNMFRSLHADQKTVSQVRYFCILHCLYFVYVQIHIVSCSTFQDILSV